MIITMYILQDILSELEMKIKIKNGSTPLKGIRLGKKNQEGDYAYISKQGKNVRCKNGEDEIIIYEKTSEEVSNWIQDGLDRLYEWERDLYSVVYRKGKLQDLVDISVPIFKNPIFIVDELDMVRALSNHEFGTVNEEWDYILQNKRMPFDKVSTILQDKFFEKEAVLSGKKRVPFLYSPPGMYHRGVNFRIPSLKEGEYQGTFVIVENETPITVGMIHISRVLADVVCDWIENAEENRELKTRTDFLRNL
jgi:hypothetical protein